ncbi:heterokaryon incompatibility protein-domain-containing protein [Hyaloscypha finlandica]|nr:heterokaryon incompatibility protein-domain-containing protein [Hyaloscypha finlandica]
MATMTLCKTCAAFDFQALTQGPRGYRLKNVVANASECAFCTLLAKIAIRLDEGADNPPEEDDWLHFEIERSSQPPEIDADGGSVAPLRACSLEILRGTLFGKVKGRRIRLHVAADSGTPAASTGDIVGRYYDSEPTSVDQVYATKAWLDECCSHKACRQTMSGTSVDANDALLPSRCIEVTGPEEGLKLVKTMGKGKYLTLSHRWGEAARLCRTTLDNYAERLEGRGLDNLSQLFQDAIGVARRLGIPYIWIDSLCIIQPRDGKNEAEEDLADWEIESEKMARYYQGSLFTIAATSGSESDGLFPDRVVIEREIVRLPYRDTTGQQQGYFYIVYPFLCMDDEYTEAVHRANLLTRGWVFQEWLLSRRVVCYTPVGTFFECQAAIPKTELGELGEQRGNRNLLLKQYFDFGRAENSLFWCEIVAAYSRRNLTNGNDRLKALSGVAREFSKLLQKKGPNWEDLPDQQGVETPDRYISGIWLRDIYHGLLWKSSDDKKPYPRTTNMPTWSWASTQTPVIWRDTQAKNSKLRHPHLKIVELILAVKPEEGDPRRISVSALDRNPFDVAELVSRLVVDGLTHPVQVGAVVKNADIPGYFYDKPLPQLGESGFDPHQPKTTRLIYHRSAPKIVCGWGSFEDPDFQSLVDFLQGEITALLVSTVEKVDGGWNAGFLKPWHTAYDVLLLRPDGADQYRRVGMGYLWGREIKKCFRDGRRRKLELV